MRVLTKREEIDVLKMLDYEDRLDNGSSRFVMDVSDKIFDYLKLDPSREYVLKLAVGHGGFNQHQREVEMWKDVNDNSFLAEIFAAGYFISIMEKVETCDYIDFAEGMYWDDDKSEAVRNFLDYEWNIQEDDDEFEPEYNRMLKVADSICNLAYYNGTTSDNGQLGLTPDGRYVAYDYGFISGNGCDSQCSNDLVDNICDEDCFCYYVNELATILGEMADAEDKLDHLFKYVKAVEYTINSGDWDWAD